jgi:hypothetical protein
MKAKRRSEPPTVKVGNVSVAIYRRDKEHKPTGKRYTGTFSSRTIEKRSKGPAAHASRGVCSRQAGCNSASGCTVFSISRWQCDRAISKS